MKLIIIYLLALAPAILPGEGFSRSDDEGLTAGLTEKLGSFVSGDLMFRNEDSVLVNLKYQIDKPTLLTLVYYQCPDVCDPLMMGVAELIDRSDVEIGKDYQVLTVSFNWDETPVLARKKKKMMSEHLATKGAIDNWHFFTGDSANIMELTREVGYGFYRKGNDFFHPAVSILLSPSGKVVNYMNGILYNPVEFGMIVKSAGEEKVSTTMIRRLKYCFNYDPEGRHRYRRVVTASGGIILLGAFLILLIFPPSMKRKNKSAD